MGLLTRAAKRVIRRYKEKKEEKTDGTEPSHANKEEILKLLDEHKLGAIKITENKWGTSSPEVKWLNNVIELLIEEREQVENVCSDLGNDVHIPVPVFLSLEKNFCTESAIQMLLAYLNISKSQDEINKEVPYFEDKNLIPYLEKTTGRKFIQKSKLTEQEIKDLLLDGKPILLRLDGKHTVVIVGFDGGAHVLDPDKGNTLMGFNDVIDKMSGVAYMGEGTSPDSVTDGIDYVTKWIEFEGMKLKFYIKRMDPIVGGGFMAGIRIKKEGREMGDLSAHLETPKEAVEDLKEDLPDFFDETLTKKEISIMQKFIDIEFDKYKKEQLRILEKYPPSILERTFRIGGPRVGKREWFENGKQDGTPDSGNPKERMISVSKIELKRLPWYLAERFKTTPFLKEGYIAHVSPEVEKEIRGIIGRKSNQSSAPSDSDNPTWHCWECSTKFTADDGEYCDKCNTYLCPKGHCLCSLDDGKRKVAENAMLSYYGSTNKVRKKKPQKDSSNYKDEYNTALESLLSNGKCDTKDDDIAAKLHKQIEELGGEASVSNENINSKNIYHISIIKEPPSEESTEIESITYYSSKEHPSAAILRSLFNFYGKDLTIDQVAKDTSKTDNIVKYIDNTTDKVFISPKSITEQKIEELIDSNIPIMIRIVDKYTILVKGYTPKSYIYNHPELGEDQVSSKGEIINTATQIIYEFRLSSLKKGKELLDEIKK